MVGMGWGQEKKRRKQFAQTTGSWSWETLSLWEPILSHRLEPLQQGLDWWMVQRKEGSQGNVATEKDTWRVSSLHHTYLPVSISKCLGKNSKPGEGAPGMEHLGGPNSNKQNKQRYYSLKLILVCFALGMEPRALFMLVLLASGLHTLCHLLYAQPLKFIHEGVSQTDNQHCTLVNHYQDEGSNKICRGGVLRGLPSGR